MALRTDLQTLGPLIAPIAAVTLFGMSLAMSFPLFGLMLERGGASGMEIGFNTMAAAVNMVIGAPLMPFILRRIGMGRLMVLATLLLAAMMMAIPLYSGFWYWTAIRLFYSFAATLLFFASEYWIVAASPELRRGRIIAIYALCVSGGFALGPLILRLTGLDGILPFAVAAIVALSGLAPILWGLSSAPNTRDHDPPSPLAALRFFIADAEIVFAVVLFGTIEFGAVALIAVWGVRSGLTEADAAVLLAAFAVGAMVLQIPLGWAADRFDRRKVLAVIAAGSVLAPLGIVAAGPSYWLIAVFAAFWGAISVGLYSVALTEFGARYRGGQLVQANAAVIFGYGIGALFSPLLLGIAMDGYPPDGLMFGSAAMALVYLALVVVRLRRTRNPLTAWRR